MKIFLPFCLLLSLSIHPLFAQQQPTATDSAAAEVENALDEAVEFAQENLEFGVKAGLNFASFNDDQVFNADSRMGVHLGFFGRYLFSRRLSGKVELLYSSQGARTDEFSIFDNYAIHLNYLSIPILGEIMIADQLRLELGPYIGVLVSSRQSFKGLVGGREVINTNNDKTNFVDVGVVGGISYNFPSGLGLGLRYNQGFADALGKDFFSDASGSNTVFQIATYYTF